MLIEVKLFATFRKGRFTKNQLEMPKGSLLSDLLETLQIPFDEVGVLLVNGRDGVVEDPLASNDIVSIFPAIGGG